jgi:EpsI family protein
MTRRALVAALSVLLASAYLASALRAEPRPIRQPLALLPLDFSNWHGAVEPDFPQDVANQLGVDEYIVRSYVEDRAAFVGLYVGFYASQRQGDTIHSPLNCLPGAGWLPIEQERTVIPVRRTSTAAAHTIEVNRFIIQKGLDRQVVFYWYQSRDRVVASEYWGKIYTVLDAIRHNRTDAALIRLTVPMGTDDGARGRAMTAGRRFVQALFPHLSNHLPL